MEDSRPTTLYFSGLEVSVPPMSGAPRPVKALLPEGPQHRSALLIEIESEIARQRRVVDDADRVGSVHDDAVAVVLEGHGFGDREEGGAHAERVRAESGAAVA